MWAQEDSKQLAADIAQSQFDMLKPHHTPLIINSVAEVDIDFPYADANPSVGRMIPGVHYSCQLTVVIRDVVGVRQLATQI